MVLMTHNTDISDTWEREGEDKDYFYRFSPEGYAIAIDVMLYSMLGEIARLQTEDVAQDEIKATSQSFLTSHYLDQETNAAQAGELARYELIGGGWRNSASLLDRLNGVTAQDVRRVANIYMSVSPMKLPARNPRSVSEPPSSDLKNGGAGRLTSSRTSRRHKTDPR